MCAYMVNTSDSASKERRKDEGVQLLFMTSMMSKKYTFLLQYSWSIAVKTIVLD